MGQYVPFIIAIIVFLIVINIRNKREEQQRLERKLKERWGNINDSKMSYEAYEDIANYYEQVKKDKDVVDDITWNDLSMDRIFMLLNNTFSSIGQEYLYKMLRIPEFDNKTLRKRNDIIKYFYEQPKQAMQLQKVYANIGKNEKISFIKSINNLCELEPKSNAKHYFMYLAYIAGFVTIFFNAGYGILILLATMVYAMFTYFSEKASVEPYLLCIKHILRMRNSAKEIALLNIDSIQEFNVSLKNNADQLSYISSKSHFIDAGVNIKGSLQDVIMDYIRMITHIDLIQFNNIVKKTKEQFDTIMCVYEDLGYIESMIAIASFRTLLPEFCEPELVDTNDKFIEATNLYHPLIAEPISNSITVDSSVLLTGSNASGKSTFLKTVAINAILSQTIYTSISTSYKAPFFKVYSSMALSDNILNGESYYMVEIKALKRIIDASNNTNVPVLAFVDEVLRGTNTIERIAASSQILLNLADSNVLCFSATHDIELTYILEEKYANYHFKEDIKDNDILFNYKLYKGRATSRNAIKLLSIIGYNNDIVEKSLQRAKNFENTGVWNM